MSNSIHLRTLVLATNYAPVSVFPRLYTVAAQDAIERYLGGRCDVVQWYNRPLLTPSRTDLFWPSVIVHKNAKSIRTEVKLRKSTLFYRDHCVCQYCGEELTLVSGRDNSITYDHVVPKSRKGKLEWTNVLASCKTCNLKKGSAHPKGKWNPKKRPHELTFAELLNIRRQFPVTVHDQAWIQFLPRWAGEIIVDDHNLPVAANDDDDVEDNVVKLFA